MLELFVIPPYQEGAIDSAVGDWLQPVPDGQICRPTKAHADCEDCP